MENYICKIATLDEMDIKWNYEIEHAKDDKNNWIIWKKENIEKYKKGDIIPYYGILNGEIICEATVNLNKELVQNSEGLVDDKTAYLSAFRTIKEFRGKGYFSKLMKYLLDKNLSEEVVLNNQLEDTTYSEENLIKIIAIIIRNYNQKVKEFSEYKNNHQ